MKLLSNKTLLVLLILISGYGYIASCTRDNDLIVPIKLTQPFAPNRGTNVHLPGNMTAGNANEWKLDANHSSVLWTTAYRGASGLLTGRFNSFGVHDVTDAKMLNYDYNANDPSNGLTNPPQPLLDSSWAFYENEPSKTYFNGYVQINTSNTGEPNRDGSPYNPAIGCNLNTLGTTAIVPGKNNLTVTNLAKIKTKEVKFDPASNGYIVTLDLTWQGKSTTGPITKTLIGTLKYIPKTKLAGVTYEGFGLQLKFSLNNKDFFISSASISDKIDIECNMNFNNQ
jgi:polyisoprenoid-binding protein YceI